MQKEPTEIPKQFSSIMGMGAPVEIYKAKTSTALNLTVFAVLFLGSGGALAYALYILWMRWGRYYPPAVLRAVLPWLVIALVAFGIAALVLWKLYTGRKHAAVVFAEGFAASDRKGVQSWRWDQVLHVTANVVRHYTSGIYTGTSHNYTLVNTKGEKVILTDRLKDVESLYTHIQNNTLQRRYQRLVDEYNRGSQVSFGPVTIGKQTGIMIGKKTYPWNTVEEVSIQKGVLSVKKKDGGWFSGAKATAGTIPNLHVLLSIINQVVGLRAGK
jgi:hypothetical protein